MELTVGDVARMAGVTVQQVNAALRDGTLSLHRRIGRTVTITDTAFHVWARSRGRGRRWNDRTREAALDLVTNGTTHHLDGSRRSRLRGVLRHITAHQFAYLAGGLGGRLARYALFETGDAFETIGPSAIDRALLGIPPGRWRFVRTDQLEDFEATHLVDLDDHGDVIVVERPRDDRSARLLLDTYLLGSSRDSQAASNILEDACHGL